MGWKSMLVLVVQMAAVSQCTGDDCPLLTNIEAPFWQNWIPEFRPQVDQAIASLQHTALDRSVSTCLASADISFTDLAALYMDNSCRRAVQRVMPKFNLFSLDTTLEPKLQEMVDHVTALRSATPETFAQLLKKFQQWAYSQPASVTKRVCNNVISNLIPCFDNAVLRLLFNNIFNNNCCSDFKTAFYNTYTGYNLTENTFKQAFRYLFNVPCTTQSPGFSSTSQTCFYSFVQILMNDKMPRNIKAALSIRDESVCDAANGKLFRTFSYRNPQQFTNSVSCCALPVDRFFDILTRMPIVQRLVPPNALRPGKCIAIKSIPFLKDLVDQTPQPLKPLMAEFTQDLCIHIPVGFTKKCDFSTSTCVNLI